MNSETIYNQLVPRKKATYMQTDAEESGEFGFEC